MARPPLKSGGRDSAARRARERSGAALAQLLRRAQGRRVAVVGDLILDHFLWGDATRISPEAPVPVVLLERESFHLGGAANVAANVRALGGRAELLGVVGEDEAGARLRALLAAAGIGADGLVTADRPTTVKQRVLAQNKHVLRVDREHSGAIGAAEERELRARAEAALASCEAVILSDYGKGCLTASLARAVLAMARRRRLPVCVDPKSRALPLGGATVVKPNARELAHLTGAPTQDEMAARRAAERLRRRRACSHVLVTRGGAGMLLVGPRGATALASAALEVADVTGAGDTVAAALGLALAGGATPEAAAALANLAAGVVVAKAGTAVATAADVLARLPGRRGRTGARA